MKTVVENNVGINSPLTTPVEIGYSSEDYSSQGRSCFYDFGAKSLVEFSGFVNSGDSAFIDEIGKCFN